MTLRWCIVQPPMHLSRGAGDVAVMSEALPEDQVSRRAVHSLYWRCAAGISAQDHLSGARSERRRVRVGIDRGPLRNGGPREGAQSVRTRGGEKVRIQGERSGCY